MGLILFVRSEVVWDLIGWRTDVSVNAAGTVSERFLYKRFFYRVQYRQCQFKASHKTSSSTGCFFYRVQYRQCQFKASSQNNFLYRVFLL
jgi:hypothetical protein